MIQEHCQIQHTGATATIIIYRIRGIGRIGNYVFTVLHEIPSPAFSFLFNFSFLPNANLEE
jgi:hypothetical protein